MDPKSALYVTGSELDFVDALQDGGFKVKNPNASASCSASGHACPSVPQCMKTMTTPARFFAALTAASVRRVLIEFASPGRCRVATQDGASSATCDTPMIAILVPLIVVT